MSFFVIVTHLTFPLFMVCFNGFSLRTGQVQLINTGKHTWYKLQWFGPHRWSILGVHLAMHPWHSHKFHTGYILPKVKVRYMSTRSLEVLLIFAQIGRSLPNSEAGGHILHSSLHHSTACVELRRGSGDWLTDARPCSSGWPPPHHLPLHVDHVTDGVCISILGSVLGNARMV